MTFRDKRRFHLGVAIYYCQEGEIMKKNNIQTLVFNSVIAAIYVVFTLVFAPFSYSTKLLFIELRISEILLVLTFYNKKWNYSLYFSIFFKISKKQFNKIKM